MPKGFLFENVKGILQANKADDWNIIVESFSSVGYQLNYMILDAADYGVPQHRERLVMVGVRKDIAKNFLFPLPTHGPDSKGRTPYVTAGQAFKDIDDPDEVVPPYNGKYGHLLPDIPPGLNYSFYTEKMGHPAPQFAWRSKFSGFLYKLSPDQVSKTIVAHQGKYDGPFHWKNRKLNVKELKRLQSFPDDYLFIESKVESVKQIGNSVAPSMANALAKAAAKQLFGVTDCLIDLMPQGFECSHGARKALKAKKTRSKTIKNVASSNQLSLLKDERVYTKRHSINDKLVFEGDKVFARKAKLNNGKWKIELKTVHHAKVRHHIVLDFSNPAGCEFKKIDAEIACEEVLDLRFLWDAIHDAVRQSSSYESLQPLYGHFTEPYPKFTMKYNASLEKDGSQKDAFMLGIFEKFAQFNDLSKTQSFETLPAHSDDVLQYLRELRECNFDIRIHETNRAIKKDHYKICYPFSLPSNSKRYVTWKEIGQHNTGDVIVERYGEDVRISQNA
jgi:DNA (cytosine-5)-methyltransferase 1